MQEHSPHVSSIKFFDGRFFPTQGHPQQMSISQCEIIEILVNRTDSFQVTELRTN